ncbi:MAG: FAD-binding protein [Deltaproteobacteria bacterium]|nr:MAG: FAD-binding protein [Deltaproteobacteria bacterium]
MQLRVFDLAIPRLPATTPAEHEGLLRDALRQKLAGVPLHRSFKVIKRALDTRRGGIKTIYTLDVEVPAAWGRRLLRLGRAQPVAQMPDPRFVLRRPPAQRPVIVGAGPAGLFAALTLAEAGARPIVLDRGKPVHPRARDVSRLYAQGILDPESNVCYGEGGAGTFSDGKLYTRVNDPRVGRILRLLVRHGGPQDILVDNRPHLGTDRNVARIQVAEKARRILLAVVV